MLEEKRMYLKKLENFQRDAQMVGFLKYYCQKIVDGIVFSITTF